MIFHFLHTHYKFGGILSSLVIETLQSSQIPSGFSVSLAPQIIHIMLCPYIAYHSPFILLRYNLLDSSSFTNSFNTSNIWSSHFFSIITLFIAEVSNCATSSYLPYSQFFYFQGYYFTLLPIQSSCNLRLILVPLHQTIL